MIQVEPKSSLLPSHLISIWSQLILQFPYNLDPFSHMFLMFKSRVSVCTAVQDKEDAVSTHAYKNTATVLTTGTGTLSMQYTASPSR